MNEEKKGYASFVLFADGLFYDVQRERCGSNRTSRITE
ncbi:hypothetical protein MUS_0955 [Bacillus velezensis YAU B9601-Y2]|uniref:Uncharacterized protein n=1 Tax=Bacillus amyloliquefaciens (strain Y2) TaxID=1155777 RepID=I2C2X0_BACAY|nr:hypothetical protein MUS_0955 [Bacillus velezensis YAU B9601-Y2]KYC87844.1 hypothetical protein B4140_1013 [Bacillus amyloliquefaciens]RUS06260.1 hypothetical protein EFW58_02300 [Bacillus velezensis]